MAVDNLQWYCLPIRLRYEEPHARMVWRRQTTMIHRPKRPFSSLRSFQREDGRFLGSRWPPFQGQFARTVDKVHHGHGETRTRGRLNPAIRFTPNLWVPKSFASSFAGSGSCLSIWHRRWVNDLHVAGIAEFQLPSLACVLSICKPSSVLLPLSRIDLHRSGK